MSYSSSPLSCSGTTGNSHMLLTTVHQLLLWTITDNSRDSTLIPKFYFKPSQMHGREKGYQ